VRTLTLAADATLTPATTAVFISAITLSFGPYCRSACPDGDTSYEVVNATMNGAGDESH
jgi:hypothetical protein